MNAQGKQAGRAGGSKRNRGSNRHEHRGGGDGGAGGECDGALAIRHPDACADRCADRESYGNRGAAGAEPVSLAVGRVG
ncbi:MAG: hypothetical protein AVDCRST_MAG77-2964 [uncultured Chloroflexi bacterium]|uniref:Uncharacterized protein n=1 Tax=uncultured Chloroflexota bacterium TaxID=166587 RepID=A0A6J4IBA7_9CHLR|nr:MAG: hypothetical protein AVDCRST_MAG77-2964 [uncultured Chloroflexota bacterium]